MILYLNSYLLNLLERIFFRGQTIEKLGISMPHRKQAGSKYGSEMEDKAGSTFEKSFGNHNIGPPYVSLLCLRPPVRFSREPILPGNKL
jgi:hypothetical protein